MAVRQDRLPVDVGNERLRHYTACRLESLPRRVVTVSLPLAAFLFVLLFPFYWMTMTSFKSNAELVSRDANPFWIATATLESFEKLLFRTEYPQWLFNTMLVSVVSTFLSLVFVPSFYTIMDDAARRTALD